MMFEKNNSMMKKMIFLINSNRKKIYWIAGFVIAVLGIAVIPGCKKYADPPPYFETDSTITKHSKRKVLFIGIDGAAGMEYQKIKPPVLMGLKAHSKFSFEAVSDDVTTDASSWETIMTGVSYIRHQIKDSSLIYSQPPGSSEHDIIPTYPSFLNYLLGSAGSDTRIGAVSPWKTLLDKLFPEAEDKVWVTDDAVGKDSAIALIKKPSSDVIFVDFNSVAKAGIQYGFSADESGYVAAVNKVDGYIGDIMAALKSRPEYNKTEEWLVVVVGTHGGKGNGYGGPSAEETTVPLFYYNENFKEKEFVTEGLFTGVEISGKDPNAIKAKLLNDNGLYNPGRGEQTFQVKVKGTSGSYPHFISKMEAWPSKPGWSMFTAGANWAMSIRSTTSGEIRAQGNAKPVFDGSWHTISFTIADSAGQMYLRRYTDGIRNETVNINSIYNNGGSVETAFPLTFGWGADPGMPATTYTTADAMIFDKALTDGEIINNICLTDITKHPEYSHLIGYWPGDDGFGGRLKNRAPGKDVDFILSGPFKWARVNDMPCTRTGVTDPLKESLMVKSTDFAPIFFYWLRVDQSSKWNLEGNNWLSNYEREFVKI